MIENDFNLEGGKRDPKGDQFWVFIGRTDADTGTLILWPPMQRVDSLEKILMLEEIGGRRPRG